MSDLNSHPDAGQALDMLVARSAHPEYARLPDWVRTTRGDVTGSLARTHNGASTIPTQ